MRKNIFLLNVFNHICYSKLWFCAAKLVKKFNYPTYFEINVTFVVKYNTILANMYLLSCSLRCSCGNMDTTFGCFIFAAFFGELVLITSACFFMKHLWKQVFGFIKKKMHELRLRQMSIRFCKQCNCSERYHWLQLPYFVKPWYIIK